MKFLDKILGRQDKIQQARGEQVSDYVHAKKNNFTAEMLKIQIEAKKVHKKAGAAHEESKRLLDVVDDITAKIARAQGAIS